MTTSNDGEKSDNEPVTTRSELDRKFIAAIERLGRALRVSRQAIATELRSIADEMVGVANTQQFGRPIFGGNTGSSQAFDDSGTYLGDGGEVRRTVGNGVSYQVNVTGEDAFGTSNTADPLNGNMFEMLREIADRIEAGSPAAVGLDAIDGARTRLHDAQATAEGTDRLMQFIADDFTVVAEARAPMKELRAALAHCRGAGSTEPGPSEQIERLTEFCVLVFNRVYDDAAARLADLGQLAALASEYGTRSRFLTEITLDPPASTSDLAGPPHLDDDYLILSTIHSAKGGEWQAVFVIHAADGNIPSDMALSEPGGLEEERRLLYVALTRAKDHLHVTVPQRFYHKRFSSSPEHSYALPSRFLDSAMDEFEHASAGVPQHGDGDGALADGADPVADVLEDLWR